MENARKNTEQSSEEEKIKLAIMGSSIDDEGTKEKLDEESFKKELKNQFGTEEL